MKKQMFIILLATLIFSPSYSMWQDDKVKLQSDSVTSDSIEYDLIIMELGYDTYLVSQPPMNFYTESYYKQWNQRYVMEYNNRYRSGPNQDLYENEIYYDYKTDYGLELEYKLYYYFRFFEQKYNVKLIPRYN